MKRHFVLIIVGLAVVTAAGMTFAQQQRPYNDIMKDVGAAFASLRKNLDSNDAAAAAEDAAKLQALFTETEAFWAPLDTQDAVGFAKRARDAAQVIGNAAKSKDVKAAQASVAALQKNCGNCHFSHREETGKGYLIRP